MKFLDLFAGIGGFSLGLERAGMRCVGQVEINPFCRKVLEKHWPNVKRIENIKNVRGDEFGSVELVCGGYPCQCDSTAGNMQGENDDRWLWPEMFRIIKFVRPAWVIGENVINHENMGLKLVIANLEGAGYQVRPFVIPNAACGLPTVERHIWTIATSTRVGSQRCETVAHSYNGDAWKFQGTDSREYKRWNLPESRVCRIRQGVPDQLDRIKSLGNAVSPQVVEVIGRVIMRIEQYEEMERGEFNGVPQ